MASGFVSGAIDGKGVRGALVDGAVAGATSAAGAYSDGKSGSEIAVTGLTSAGAAAATSFFGEEIKALGRGGAPVLSDVIEETTGGAASKFIESVPATIEKMGETIDQIKSDYNDNEESLKRKDE
jgi:hypothetical protein